MECNFCGGEYGYVWQLDELLRFEALIPPRLCPKCLEKFQRLPKTGSCQGCQRPSSEIFCPDCQSWQQMYPQYDFRHEALYAYNEGMHDWFQQYKFKGDYRLRASFEKALIRYFLDFQDWWIVPIPLSPKRLEQRGFNQVTAFLNAAGLGYHELLIKPQETLPQSGKNRQERLETLQPFQVKAEFSKDSNCFQKQILLVDDIYTTGRTLFHAAAAIAVLKPKKVRSFSLAR